MTAANVLLFEMTYHAVNLGSGAARAALDQPDVNAGDRQKGGGKPSNADQDAARQTEYLA